MTPQTSVLHPCLIVHSCHIVVDFPIVDKHQSSTHWAAHVMKGICFTMPWQRTQSTISANFLHAEQTKNTGLYGIQSIDNTKLRAVRVPE